MQRHHVASILFGCLLLASPAIAGPESVHEGEWEITSTTVIPGIPVPPRPFTRTQCITKKDMIPKPEQDKGNCQITHKIEANKVSFTVKCEGGARGGSADGKGEITYTGDTMEGNMVMKIQHPRAPNGIEANQTIKGRRIGDCKK